MKHLLETMILYSMQTMLHCFVPLVLNASHWKAANSNSIGFKVRILWRDETALCSVLCKPLPRWEEARKPTKMISARLWNNHHKIFFLFWVMGWRITRDKQRWRGEPRRDRCKRGIKKREKEQGFGDQGWKSKSFILSPGSERDENCGLDYRC